MDLDPGLKGDSKDDESDDGEPEVAAHFVKVLRAEEFSIVQVVELALATEQVQKMECNVNSHIITPFDRFTPSHKVF